MVRAVGHPRANKQGYVMEHILVAERALGKPLPPGAQVHHVDKDRTNNAPSNLVICEDAAYHQLLHNRMRAMDATGDPNTVRCGDCGRWRVEGHEDACKGIVRNGRKPRGFAKHPLLLGRCQYDQRSRRSAPLTTDS
jgi:hypothetical protein